MLNRIDKLADLLSLLPKLLALQHKLDGLWEPEMTPESFLAEIITVYQNSGVFFIDEDSDGFRYVIVMRRDTDEVWVCWLFYVSTRCRDLTRSIITELSDFCRGHGVSIVRFSTTRTTRSYERWATKFGAQKYAAVYQLEL